MSGCDEYIGLISEYLDGELSDDGERRLFEHIAVCPECASLFEILDTAASVREDDVEPPPELIERVMASVRAENEKKAPKITMKRRVRRMIAIAACAAVLVPVAYAALSGAGRRSLARKEVSFDNDDEEVNAPSMYMADFDGAPEEPEAPMAPDMPETDTCGPDDDAGLDEILVERSMFPPVSETLLSAAGPLRGSCYAIVFSDAFPAELDGSVEREAIAIDGASARIISSDELDKLIDAGYYYELCGGEGDRIVLVYGG